MDNINYSSMDNYYIVATLEDLIERIDMEINNQKEYDHNEYNLYKKRLKDFLKDLRVKYGNIYTIAAVSLIKKTNEKNGYKISENIQGKNKEIAESLEDIIRSKTKFHQEYLISVEYPTNLNPILIVGKPDGLIFEYGEVKILEVKSFNLDDFFNCPGSKKDENLIKKVISRIKTSSDQLSLYQYLLENTIKLGLIGNTKKSDLYGRLIFYSENTKHLYNAQKIIKNNLNIIKTYGNGYHAYNLNLEERVETTHINNEDLYYFKIGFRVRYNPKTIEKYLNNLNELIGSSKLVDNRDL